MKFLLYTLLIISFFSCKKERFLNDPGAKLKFSIDTLTFDTVFSQIGSTTKYFKVINPYSQPLIINHIFLAGGNNSNYRLNINGFSLNSLKDIELRENDSLYVFVEVTVDPTNASSPLSVLDSVIFIFNDNTQKVMLLAWGQDVNLINGEIFSGNIYWSKNKPYLIYNSMLIDSSSILTIEAGAKLHFHNRSRMYIAGTLVANGTLDEPISFEGDRLEEWYKDIPGQWDGIYFLPGSKNNYLNYCNIKNAIVGIQADTVGDFTNPTLSIHNSKILNMNAAGIYGRGTTILASNCVIGNCGQFALALTLGGSYEFYHCTVFNDWRYSNRTSPSIFLNNYYKDIYGVYQVRVMEKAFFGNCILYGNKEYEIYIDEFPGSPVFNYKFDHCLIKSGPEFNTSNPEHFNQIYKNLSPKFINPQLGNYELDTLSNAKDRGSNAIANMFPYDIVMNYRLGDVAPDLGAYERIE